MLCNTLRLLPNSSVCLSFDFDALSVWFGYERTTPAMLARGEYGARVGYKVTDAMTVDLFANGVSGEGAVDTRVHAGAGIRFNY